MFATGDRVEVRIDWRTKGPEDWQPGTVSYADKCEVLVYLTGKARTVPLRQTSDRIRRAG